MDNLETDMAELIESNLKSADWLIFNTLNVSENIPSSAALRRILAERPELLSEKKVIVFALDSPILSGCH